jgi:NADP-dependent 3-hydroxy acid dehydrogenase YdfG
MSLLQGKVACITGASGGIGEAIAVALAKAGASVVLGARRLEELQRVKDAIEADIAGSAVLIQKTDVTRRADVKALVAAAEAAYGPVDIMVNNAGVMYFTQMKNLHEDEWEQMVDVNCKGVMHGVGAVLGSMTERGELVITAVLVNSLIFISFALEVALPLPYKAASKLQQRLESSVHFPPQG